MAEVASVMAASIVSGFTCSVPDRSPRTLAAPACSTGQIVVDQVSAGTITSEPRSMRRGSAPSAGSSGLASANSAIRFADDPEFITACSTPM